MEKTISYSYARQHLSALLDSVIDDSEVVCIQRKSGKEAIVIGKDDYTSLLETAYLLRSPENSRQLFQALEEANRGEGVEIEL